MTSPNILVTNDDGVDAEGLRALEEAMQPLGNVVVVAPDSEQSGVGHGISLHNPLRVRRHGDDRYSVSGTPADCVYFALNELLDETPDLCVSGINHGANLADDLIYSGTVAGAREATLCDVPAVAVSLATYRPEEFSVAADFSARIAGDVLDRGLPRDVLLNVNVPSDADSDTPTRVAKLGRRNYQRFVTRKEDPQKRPYFWLGSSELTFDDIPGSDCNAITQSSITVTPVHMDRTHYAFMRELREWDFHDEDADE